MENQERLNKIKELNKQIKQINQQYVDELTSYKIGDIIEFIEITDEIDNRYEYYHKEEIFDFNVLSNGEIHIETKRKIHYFPPIEKIKLFNPDDYTLRDKIDPPKLLNLNDEFYVTTKKEHTTKGKLYKVHKITETIHDKSYFFTNDINQSSFVIYGEYRQTL